MPASGVIWTVAVPGQGREGREGVSALLPFALLGGRASIDRRDSVGFGALREVHDSTAVSCLLLYVGGLESVFPVFCFPFFVLRDGLSGLFSCT